MFKLQMNAIHMALHCLLPCKCLMALRARSLRHCVGKIWCSNAQMPIVTGVPSGPFTCLKPDDIVRVARLK